MCQWGISVVLLKGKETPNDLTFEKKTWVTDQTEEVTPEWLCFRKGKREVNEVIIKTKKNLYTVQGLIRFDQLYLSSPDRFLEEKGQSISIIRNCWFLNILFFFLFFVCMFKVHVQGSYHARRLTFKRKTCIQQYILTQNCQMTVGRRLVLWLLIIPIKKSLKPVGIIKVRRNCPHFCYWGCASRLT